jgi:DNA-binding HxlR family transcriptional regulator
VSKRSYGQLCPLARALDIVGERWTLLILSELGFGPKRYTDLMDALPSIGPQVLAVRLRELSAAGLVEKDRMPPPAASTVYQLTAMGRELKPALAALARFGLQFAQTPEVGDRFRLGSYLTALTAPRSPRPIDADNAVVEVRVDEEVFHVWLKDGAVDVREGAAETPDATLMSDRATFLRLAGGETSLGEALQRKQASIEGDRRLAEGMLSELLELDAA